MSELKKVEQGRLDIRQRFLVTASVATLLFISTIPDAIATEDRKPIIWLDLGGQFDQLNVGQSKWSPNYASDSRAGPLSMTNLDLQNPPKVGYEVNAGILYRPDGDDWVFSASARVGRARRSKDVSVSAYILPFFRHHIAGGYASQYNGHAYSNESHEFVDFRVGRDLGVGLFGAESTVSAGVRIANMRSRSDVHISSGFPITYYGNATNAPNGQISREFRGIGPAVAWSGSAPLVGKTDTGQVGLDWEINAAVLFGRQRMKQSVDGYYRQLTYDWTNFAYVTNTQNVHSVRARQRSVTVPNLGGFVALTYRFSDAKVSLGYRVDAFFGAMDGGIDVRKTYDRNFYGPFTTISIGLP